VDAFNQLGLPLIIIGDGPELPRLSKMANSNIKFLGFQADETVAKLLGKARAFVCAAEEDFGIAIVEAQAAGCPVIAYGAGGALETVEAGVTGLFFEKQDAGSLIEGVRKFEASRSKFQTLELIQNAKRFDKPHYISEFKKFVESNG
jgi:glycosyltransferase involved in cell wall biosynthesis